MRAQLAPKAKPASNNRPTETPIPLIESENEDVAAQPPVEDPTAPILMLRTADDYLASGAQVQAEELYHILIEEHPHTIQAEHARQRLLEMHGEDERTELILNRLMRMADSYRSSGALWQAQEMYSTLMDDHAGTAQSALARDRLMDLCEAYEQDGQLHHARSLYERLL